MTDSRAAGRGPGHRYLSTYCIHEIHDQCRLTCKTCSAPCTCSCHNPAGPGEEGARFDPLENVWVERDCPGVDCRTHPAGQHTHVRKVSGWKLRSEVSDVDPA